MSDFYEDQQTLSEYLPFHNGDPKQIVLWKFGPKDGTEIKEIVSGHFDFIIPSNLICRLPDPRSFLENIADLLNLGGVFILSTPLLLSRIIYTKTPVAGMTILRSNSKRCRL